MGSNSAAFGKQSVSENIQLSPAQLKIFPEFWPVRKK
jgi:hypothetical protein